MIPCRLPAVSRVGIALSLFVAVAGCQSEAGEETSSSTPAGQAKSHAAATTPPVQPGTPRLPVPFTSDDKASVRVTDLSRIVVLDDATVEIVHALGLGDKIEATPKPSMVEKQAAQAPKRIPTGGGRGSLTVEGITAYKPTLVIGSNMKRHADLMTGLRKTGVPAAMIDTSQPAPAKIRKTGSLLGVPSAGRKLASGVQAQYRQAAARIKGVSEKPRVMMLSSSGAGDSGKTTAAGKDTPADQIIVQAGGLNTGAESGLDRFQAITAEGLVAAKPEVILVTQSELKSLGGRTGIWSKVEGLKSTPAAQEQKLIVMPDMQLRAAGTSSGVGVLNLLPQLHPDA